jgi:hypothetical protein
MNKTVLIIVSLSMMIFVSCKQQEKIVNQKLQDVISEDEIESLIFNGNDEIKTIKLKKINFKINVNDETYESGGNIAILKDSIIIISLIPIMGYEVARIFCFKNNMLIIDRQNKTYYYTPYEKNIGQYSIKANFNDIESILMGRAFIYRGKTNDEILLKNRIKEDKYIKYFFEIKEYNFVKSKQEIMVREDNLLTERNEITDNGNKLKLYINYGQFKEIDYLIFPHEIEIIVNNATEKINLNIDIGNIIINEEVNANVIIPDKYKEIIFN